MKRPNDYTGILAVAFLMAVLGFSAFVGFVKFMAFWRVAFGG